jgi:hypothetical protein
LFREWAIYQEAGLHYSNGDTWDRMLQQGIQLLDCFAQDDRVRIRQPRRSLQVKFTRPVSPTNDFVAYVDALGKLDGKGCLLEWKTTSSRYPEEPDGLLALDPQLVCYSWVTGISDVAQVVFVRKRLIEVQYLTTTITDEQRQEFGRLVEDTIQRIEACQFIVPGPDRSRILGEPSIADRKTSCTLGTWEVAENPSSTVLRPARPNFLLNSVDFPFSLSGFSIVPLKTKHLLALFRKNGLAPPHVNVERRRHIFRLCAAVADAPTGPWRDKVAVRWSSGTTLASQLLLLYTYNMICTYISSHSKPFCIIALLDQVC